MPEGRAAPPHGLLFLVVISTVLGVPVIIRDRIVAKFIPEIIIRRRDLIFLPLILVLVIRLISSKNYISPGDIFGRYPDSLHRIGGSTVIVFFLILGILLILNQRLFFSRTAEESDDD